MSDTCPMLARLAIRSLWSRRQLALLMLLSVILSVLLLLGAERLREDVRNSFANTISGADLLVGARTSPINLLLYSVFFRGNPTNLVSWKTYEKVAAQEPIKWTIPMSLGDSHHGQRVLGTTQAYFEHYRYGARQPLAFARGRVFTNNSEVALGAEAARRLGYELGQKLKLSHGMGEVSFVEHEETFRVSGVLEPTGTPIDQLLFVPLEAISEIHGHGAEYPDLTAFLVGLYSPTSVFTVQRALNDYSGEPLTAIIPAVTLMELWDSIGVAETALVVVSGFAVLTSLFGMMITMLATLNGRRTEMAVLRAVGAGPLQVAGLSLIECLVLTAVGTLVAPALLSGLILLMGSLVQRRFGLIVEARWPSGSEWLLLGGVVAAAGLLALVPTWRAYRTTLADGLIPRL